jgi:hypothetical protein
VYSRKKILKREPENCIIFGKEIIIFLLILQ